MSIEQQKEIVEHQVRKPFYKKSWFFIPVAILFAVGIIAAAMDEQLSNTPTTQAPILTPSPALTPTFAISNPVYLKDPSAYLVDDKDTFVSSPEGALWVEGVLGARTLKVSYAMEKAGTKILKISSLSIPWLGLPVDSFASQTKAQLWLSSPVGQCWQGGAKAYLEKNFLHTVVYLKEIPLSKPIKKLLSDELRTDQRLFADVSNTNDGRFHTVYLDIALSVIQNGYGAALPSAHDAAYSDRFTPPTISSRDVPKYTPPLDLNPDPVISERLTELKENQGVASLAKRGLWGTCQ